MVLDMRLLRAIQAARVVLQVSLRRFSVMPENILC